MAKFAVLILLFTAARAYAAATDDCWDKYPGALQIPVTVAYQPSKGAASQKFSVYKPVGNSPPYKTVMMIHGGCFLYGGRDEEDTKAMIKRFTNAGYAVVSVDYRLAQYPKSMCDVQDAVRYIRQHGAADGLNTSKLMAFGYSAGGTLADYLGTRDIPGGENCADASLSALREPLAKPVDGVIDFFGRTDFLNSHHEATDSGLDCGESYVGDVRSVATLDKFKRADVLSNLKVTSTDFLIVHGTSDKNVSEDHSCMLYDKLLDPGSDPTQSAHPCAHLNQDATNCESGAGGRAQICKIIGAEHMFTKPADGHTPSEMDQAFLHVCPFLNKVLGSPSPAHVAGIPDDNQSGR